MPQIVEVPGLGDVEFPDGTPKATMEAAIKAALLKRQPESTQQSFPLPGEQFMPATGLESIGRRFQEFAAPIISRGAPAAAGGILGGAAGALGGPIAPVTVPLGVAMGGIAGEAIRQGVTGERDPLGLALQGMIPAGARMGAGAARIATKFGMRRSAAETLNVLGAEEAAGAIVALRSPAQVNQLFAAARQSGSQIPMTKFLGVADEVASEVGKLSGEAKKALGPVTKRIQSIVADAKTSGSAFTPDKLQAELEAFADLTKSIRRTGGQGGRFADKALGAMLSDLDEAALAAAQNPAMQGAQALLEARKGFLRNQTINEMEEVIKQAFQVRRGMGEAAQFNPTQVIKGFQKNPFFEKAFTAQEQQEIFSLLKKINRIPVLPPPRGTEFGSGAMALRLGARLGAGGGAAFLGASPEVALAAATLPDAIRFSKDIALTLQFKEGRQLLGRLLAGTDGAITPQVAQVLGSFAATKVSEQLQPQIGP